MPEPAVATSTAWRRSLAMFALIAAGEGIFFLPFVLARIFRPTLLDVLGLTNLELGTAFSLYGLVAMAAYFFGGPLADRYSARRLMCLALFATAAGGIVLASLPSLRTLEMLFAFWGLTTILLFWAPLIRATRAWGGQAAQGRAYGLLDGGRGLFAALLASLGVAFFASLLPADAATASLADRAAALEQMVWLFTALTAGCGVLVWLAVPDDPLPTNSASSAINRQGLRAALAMPEVWLQALIVLCAYVGYKSGDDFSLYARDAFGYDDVAAARLGTVSFWMRPFAALAAGLLADRIRPTRTLGLGFSILLVGSLLIAGDVLAAGEYWTLVATVAVTAIGIHSLRGVYFATLAETRVPWTVTGSAVGVVSFLGYTPDVFMGPLSGYLLDRSPGALGHRHLFVVVALFAALGLVASWCLARLAGRRAESP